MNSFQQIIAGIYVALAEAAGGPAALRRANQVLRDAIADGAVDDPLAIGVLESLVQDEDDEEDLPANELERLGWLPRDTAKQHLNRFEALLAKVA